MSISIKIALRGDFCVFLFFSLLVRSRSATPLTILFELNLALHQFLVFGGPVVYALAFAACELY